MNQNKYLPLLSFFTLFILLLFIFVPAFKENILIVHEHIRSALIGSYKVNGWILLFLVLFSMVGFGYVLYTLYYTKPRKSFYANYRSESIKNALWKWQWKENSIESLWCFCPKCNGELSYNTDFLLQEISFSCQNCQQEITKIQGENINYVLTYIKKEIRRIITKKELKIKKESKQNRLY